MLVPTLTPWFLGGGALVSLVAAALYSDRESANKVVVRIGVALGIACGVAAIIAGITGTKVIYVSGTPLDASTKLLIGSSTIHLGDNDVPIEKGAGTTIIVNDSQFPILLRSVEYVAKGHGGYGIGGGDDTIEPYSVHTFEYGSVDYVGPYDVPPRESTGRTSSELRYWLTW